MDLSALADLRLKQEERMSANLEGLKMAADTTKQVIILASALLVFTVTFAKEFQTLGTGPVPTPLKIAWLLFIVTVVAAVWTLMAITGSLQAATASTTADAFGKNIRIPAFMMVAAFIAAIIFMVLAGWSISS